MYACTQYVCSTGVHMHAIVLFVIVFHMVHLQQQQQNLWSRVWERPRPVSPTPKIDRSPSHSLILKIVEPICVSILRAGPWDQHLNEWIPQSARGVGTRQMNWERGGGCTTFLITKLGLQRTKCSWRISFVYDERGNNLSRPVPSSGPFINLNVTIKQGRGRRRHSVLLYITINPESWGWTTSFNFV